MIKIVRKSLMIFFSLMCLGLLKNAQANPFSSPQTDDSTDAKYIAKNYWEGVVKIIVYDPVVEKKFNLSKGDGYLTRGSGFFVTSDGVLFTNRHVIEWCVYGYIVADWLDKEGVMHHSDVLTYKPGLESSPSIKKVYYVGHAIPLIQVFADEEGRNYDLYSAEVLSIGEAFDGAMLRIASHINGEKPKHMFRALPLGNSDALDFGEDLIVLGYPSQYQESDLSLDLKDTLTMSYGKLSGWDHVFDDIYGFIKTTASVHEGNSGGPVFGEDERVIGIATAMGPRTKIGLVEGINGMYYVAEHQQIIFKQLIKNGLMPPKVPKRYLALSGKPRPLPSLAGFKDMSAPSSLAGLQHHSQVVKGITLFAGTDAPAGGALITVFAYDKKKQTFVPFCETQSDAKGHFVMPRSMPTGGKYRLIIKKEGFKELKQDLELGGTTQNFLTISLQQK